MKQPTLYILMRDDLDSLNPGKAIAQATHATNQFEMLAATRDDYVFTKALAVWRDGRDFGRCLTVAAKPHQIDEMIGVLDDDDCRMDGDVVIDPTYPITDGEVTHTLELMTCGWVFFWEDEDMTSDDWRVWHKLKKLSLYN